MLTIPQQTRERVADWWSRRGGEIKLPDASSWNTKSDDDIWARVVSQVVVVGNSSPMERMTDERKGDIRWSRLVVLPDEQVVHRLWLTMRTIGARYVGKSTADCRKSQALMRNLVYLRGIGGPKAFLRKIVDAPSPAMKIDLVSRNLSYIKGKGARDFLTSGFGLLRDSIALDVRVLRCLAHIGVDGLPSSTPPDKEVYAEIEKQIIDQICRPVGIDGAQLDQLLYKYRDEILGEPARSVARPSLSYPVDAIEADLHAYFIALHDRARDCAWKTDRLWTRGINTDLTRLAKRHGLQVFASRCDAETDGGEWLYDHHWRLVNETGDLVRLPLAMEIEWGFGRRTLREKVVEDYMKLVQSRADIKVLVFSAVDARAAIDELTQMAHAFEDHGPEDRFIFAGYDLDLDEIFVHVEHL